MEGGTGIVGSGEGAQATVLPGAELTSSLTGSKTGGGINSKGSGAGRGPGTGKVGGIGLGTESGSILMAQGAESGEGGGEGD